MKKSSASKALSNAIKASRHLHKSVELVMDAEPDAIGLAYRKRVGQVLGTMYFEIIEPLIDAHPTLREMALGKDSDASTAKAKAPSKPSRRKTKKKQRAKSPH